MGGNRPSPILPGDTSALIDEPISFMHMDESSKLMDRWDMDEICLEGEIAPPVKHAKGLFKVDE